MGLRFDINVASWIAYLLQLDAKVPPLPDKVNEFELVGQLLKKLETGFRSSEVRTQEFDQKISRARNMLKKYDWDDKGIIDSVLAEIREDLSDRAWTALIVPSWTDKRLDEFLCSDSLLKPLIEAWNNEQVSDNFSGLLLQLERPQGALFSLTDVFPLFEVALNNNHRWPGLLVWTNQNQSSFFPIPPKQLIDEEKIIWYLMGLIKELNQKIQLGPPGTPILPHREEPERSAYSDRIVHIIQVSDVHLGTDEADRRLPQLQLWIRQLAENLKKTGLVIPIVTGDLMNTNDEASVNRALLFIDFLSHLGTEPPKILLGNHDVRAEGIIREDFRAAVHSFIEPPNVSWYDDQKLGLICFNSVLGGDIARGEITEQQMVHLGNLVARKENWKDYLLVAALHHHPLEIQLPSWYERPFYEKVFGSWFEVTDKLVDAQQFVDFVENHHMGLVIHGHKHIPKISFTPDKRIPVFACGSSVGKVKRKDRKSYLSLNVLTIDTHERRVTGRLLAQPVGGGIESVDDKDEWFVEKLDRLLSSPEYQEQQLIYRRNV